MNFAYSVSSPCEMSEPMSNLQKKILSRFGGLDEDQLNLKDIVMKCLQIENHV